MRGAVGTHRPRSVHEKTHGQFVKAYVVNELVVRPLQKCGVYGKIRFCSAGGHTRAQCGGMLFGRSEEHTSELQSQR